MAKWKIKEVSFNSLHDLNQYIAENDIAPSSTLKYDTFFDQMKQTMCYTFTYWTVKD
jgi:hypothetical protein